MATLRDIQNRIKAVQSTQKITKAMKMVAASKLRKVQSRMLDLRPYADKMHDVLISLAGGADRESHPLLAFRPRKTVEVVVVTSDRGLCGAFNTNILKAAQSCIDGYKKDGFEVSISAVGKKARDYFKRRNVPTRNSWTGISGNVSFSNAGDIANDIKENYINETIDEVIVIYNAFKSMVAQTVTTAKLLPLAPLEEGEEESAPESEAADFIYEPSMEAIFDRLIPRNVDIQIYRALLESSAAEEAARMSAMENATQSCDEMVEKLTLQFNKARQASITGELMDIVGGVEALKG
ncbi:MAG TPA: ATP synthase F1 subunit gamma [Nitrospirae bacterium]|nr:ATP synthase gamma chain [bacterium BMS3Abin06]HDH12982.1 ATP synthase F1 subunit gamma [Nitrospirota bacterium]HDZ02957.1 ATP synthase F1 subunit gamma [Nitrospirota bacterium]